MFVIICENAFTDEIGRLNIIQVFDYINAPNFPAIHPKISIVTKWGFGENDDRNENHTQKLILTEQGTNKEIFKSEMALAPKEGKKDFLQFINNIVGLKFDKEGMYKVQVYMDGEKAETEASFDVKQIKN